MVLKLFFSSTLVGGSGLHHHLTTRKMADLNLSIGLCLSVLCFFHLLSWFYTGAPAPTEQKPVAR